MIQYTIEMNDSVDDSNEMSSLIFPENVERVQIICCLLKLCLALVCLTLCLLMCFQVLSDLRFSFFKQL